MTIQQLRAEGPMGLANIAAFAGQLEDSLAEAQTVIVDCAGMTECDLSFVQALMAGRNLADRSGKTITLAAPMPAPLATILDRCGWPLHEPREAAFWQNAGTAA